MRVFQFMLETTNDLLKVYVAANDLHSAINFIERTHKDCLIRGICIFEETFYIVLDDDDLQTEEEPKENK